MLIKNLYDFAVIGSGPTGTAALRVLAHSGATVALIDAGASLPPTLSSTVKNLAQVPWKEWPSGARNDLLALSSRGVRSKLLFGSDFAYDDGTLGLTYHSSDVRASIGIGGFSSVWGATSNLQPRTTWPSELQSVWDENFDHADALSSYMTLSGEPGALDDFLPPIHRRYPVASGTALTALARAHSFFEGDPTAHYRGLGLPTLAVASRVSHQNTSEGCTACGLCQVGCPYGHIWTSTSELEEICRSYSVTYIRGVVHRFDQTSSTSPVTVTFSDPSTSIARQIATSRLVVASGPISTASLLMKSQILRQQVRISDSQTFFFAGISSESLRTKGSNPTLTEALTLAGDQQTGHSQAQIYGPSEYLSQRLASTFPLSALPRGAIPELLLDRTVVGLCYLDSRNSGSLVVQANGAVQQQVLPRQRQYVRRASEEHGQVLRKMGIRTLLITARLMPVGGGNHLGRSLPMVPQGLTEAEDHLYSDILGRPLGKGRVHIVDSSILPVVAAGSLTLTAMANATRIASNLVMAGR